MNIETKNPVFWLKGHKTLLRPLEERDLTVIYQGINDPETWQYLANTWPKGKELEKDWIKKKQQMPTDDMTLAVCAHDGELIGTMGLHKIDWINRTAETGTVIFSADHRGKGYGYDAKMMLLYYAFRMLNLHLVTSRAIGFNDRSVNYSQKCGYKVDTRLRQRLFRDGNYYDEVILSVLCSEWLPLWEKFKQGLSN